MYLAYKTCIDACLACMAACNHCASSCLQEKDADQLSYCVRLDMECAAICRASAELMTYGSQHANAICQICGELCLQCAEECEKHEHMDHCRQCALACRHCAEECLAMAAA
jgi:hypothetical protein